MLKVSVFTFDKRKLESLLSRSSGSFSSATHRDIEEICARLRQEASFLAKLRHPAILELVEPVEEGRSSISFVTERVSACLTSVIERKASGRTGSDDEVDEIEIQKGLLQLAKGLEFLHFSAGIVHLGLVPSAIFVNAKVLFYIDFLINIGHANNDFRAIGNYLDLALLKTFAQRK